MFPSIVFLHVLVALMFLVSTNEAFKLLGMPRFLPKSSPPVASSVAGQQVTKTTPFLRDLEPIAVPTSRELHSITDKTFNENILESEGLAIVFFTRYPFLAIILEHFCCCYYESSLPCF
jgi:hypothetical protein